MTNFTNAFATAVLAAGLTGCAGTHLTAPFSNPLNSTVVNRTEDQGVKAYGSQACRDAQIDVVPGHSLQSYRGGGAYYSRFSGLYNRNQQLRQSVSVVSASGVPYTLVPSSEKSKLFEIAGTVGGALAGGTMSHGRRPTQQALTGVAGAAAGNLLGRLADNFFEAGAREAIERCRADVINGAYDRPRAPQEAPRPLGADYRQPAQPIQGYRPINPAPGTVPAVECPAGFTCTPNGR